MGKRGNKPKTVYIFDGFKKLIKECEDGSVEAALYTGQSKKAVRSALSRSAFVGKKYYFSFSKELVLPDKQKQHNPALSHRTKHKYEENFAKELKIAKETFHQKENRGTQRSPFAPFS